MSDDLGDRMKSYESGATPARFMKTVPVIVRLDGKGFHNWTKGLERPYDENLYDLMEQVTEYLCQETGAVMGYTQSDEISLIFYNEDIFSQIYFDGKRDKINSILAASCSVQFNKLVAKFLPNKVETIGLFDCRSFHVPNKCEAVNYLVWREQDATRNSIQMAGRAQFSHAQLNNLNCNQIQEKLFQEKSINWNDYPARFKRGCYIQKIKQNDRRYYIFWNTYPVVLPDIEIVNKLSSLSNREQFVFEGEQPKYEELANV